MDQESWVPREKGEGGIGEGRLMLGGFWGRGSRKGEVPPQEPRKSPKVGGGAGGDSPPANGPSSNAFWGKGFPAR